MKGRVFDHTDEIENRDRTCILIKMSAKFAIPRQTLVRQTNIPGLLAAALGIRASLSRIDRQIPERVRR